MAIAAHFDSRLVPVALGLTIATFVLLTIVEFPIRRPSAEGGRSTEDAIRRVRGARRSVGAVTAASAIVITVLCITGMVGWWALAAPALGAMSFFLLTLALAQAGGSASAPRT
jgi:hypothetical protein